MKIYFNEEEHSYKTIEPPITFTSVSKVLELVKNPFDKEGQSKKTAEKRGITQEEVLKEWQDKTDKSCERGTRIHLMKEKSLIGDNVYSVLMDKELKISYDLNYLSPGIYPELIIHSPYFKVCGTSDLVEIFPDKTFFLSDWKGFALDTPILTSVGWKCMGELKETDSVYDGDGKITKIKHLSEIHYNPCYKITFDTNAELICDNEHKWEVICRNKNNPYKPIQKEITTDDIFHYYQNDNLKLLIPCVALSQEDIILPLDPYILGLWLGDGNRTCGTLTCNNEKIWNEIKRRGFKVSIDHNRSQEQCESRTIFGISSQLRELGLLSNKHIPDIYFKASHSQRLDLLRGFMDADGYFHRKRLRCVMQTTKEWQRDEFVKLISSLGYKPTVIPYKGSGFGKTNIQMFSINFLSDDNPFLCRNTDYTNIVEKKSFFRAKHHYIKKIEKIPVVPTKCIAVESHTSTYLVGHNLIKTHNTNETISFEGYPVFDKVSNTRKPKKMRPPLTHLDDCKGQIYTLQLSIYAYLLEQFGYTCKGLRIDHIILDEEENIVEEIPYPIPYLKKEAFTLLNHFKSKSK